MTESTNVCLTAFCDGGATPNPGHAGAAYILKDDQGNQIEARGVYLGDNLSCNVAEYEGVRLAAEAAIARGATRLDIFADSVLIVKQVKCEWKLKSPNLFPYHEKVLALLSQIPSWRISWIPRTMNAGADTLCGNAIQFKRDVSYQQQVLESNSYADSIRQATADYLNKRGSQGRKYGRGRKTNRTCVR